MPVPEGKIFVVWPSKLKVLFLLHVCTGLLMNQYKKCQHHRHTREGPKVPCPLFFKMPDPLLHIEFVFYFSTIAATFFTSIKHVTLQATP